MRQLLRRHGGHGARGQSTLEYILVLAAIILAVIVGGNTAMKGAAGKSLENAKGVINAAVNKIP